MTAARSCGSGVALVSGAGACLRFLLDRRRAGPPAAAGSRSGSWSSTDSARSLLGLLHGAGVTGDALLLSGTALLGSFTTFSTWMVQSERLAAEGDGGLALVNVAGQPRRRPRRRRARLGARRGALS